MSNDAIKVTREKIEENEIPEGHEVLRVLFTKRGPTILLTDVAESLLHGPEAQTMRAAIEQAIKAVLDKIMVH